MGRLCICFLGRFSRGWILCLAWLPPASCPWYSGQKAARRHRAPGLGECDIWAPTSGTLCGSFLPPDPATTSRGVSGCRGELEAGRLPKPPSAAITHRKTLLCHQPKVALKEQFPGAPDELLTQKLAAKFPVAGGNLGTVSLTRTQSWKRDRPEGSTWPHCPDAKKEWRAPFSLATSDFGAPFLRIWAVSSGI